METGGRKCVLCDRVITDETDSREHILPNSIGGRKRVKGVLCINCNTKAADDWDAEFALQLAPLSAMFSITRDRGEVPPQLLTTTSGRQILRRSDGQLTLAKPIYEEVKTETGVRISISAPTHAHAQQLLGRVKKRYPQVDVASLVPETNYTYIDEPIKTDLQIGGVKSGRTIVKSCIALAIDAGVNANDCDNALEYLRNPNGFPCFGYFHERDLIRNRPNEVFHCVAVAGDSASGMLVGYVEYYGFYRIVVGLSDRYSGKDFKAVYAINPMTGNEIRWLDIDLSLSRLDLQDAYDYKKVPDGAMAAHASMVMPIAVANDFQREVAAVTRRAAEYAFANCGAKPGDLLTDEQKLKLPRLVTEYLMPFLLRHMRRPPRAHEPAPAQQ
jgi:HNH endonuclease